MSLRDEAAIYLDAGLSIIALSGKAPNTEFHQRGLNQAITGSVETPEDIELLTQVFTHPETTGIGIPIPPGMVVIDIDGEEGAQQYLSLVGQAIPETPTAKTGRGLHLWFATSRVEQGSRKLGPKLDLKGVGGYVAAPPSLHPDGHRYEWLVPLVVDGRVGPVEWLPEPVEHLLALGDQLFAEYHVERQTYIHHDITLQAGQLRWHQEPAPPSLVGLAKAVREAPEGNRNNLLAWAVLQARDEGANMEDVLRDLGEAAADAGLNPREIRTTIKQAYRRGPR